MSAQYVSQATGWYAIREIDSNASWQERLDFSPQQVAALRVALEKPEFRRRLVSLRNSSIEDSLLDSDRPSIAVDQLAREAVNGIIAPEQLDARRRFYLREEFKFPFSTINQEKLWLELGLSPDEIDGIRKDARTSAKGILIERSKIRFKGLEEIQSKFPTFEPKFSRAFGSGYFNTRHDFSAESIGVFDCDRATRLLAGGTILVLPFVSEQQRIAMRETLAQVEKTALGDKSYSPDRDALIQIKKILGEQSLFELVKTIRTGALDTDFRLLSGKRALEYFEIPDAGREQFVKICDETHADCYKSRIGSEQQVLIRSLSRIKDEKVRTHALAFFAKVWDD